MIRYGGMTRTGNYKPVSEAGCGSHHSRTRGRRINWGLQMDIRPSLLLLFIAGLVLLWPNICV